MKRPLFQRASAPTPEGASGSWTTDNQINDYIVSNQLDVMVRSSGEIFTAGNVDCHLLRGLVMIVENRLQAESAVTVVSPIEFRQLKEKNTRSKTAAGRSVVTQTGNATVEYVLGKAIEAAASDIYLDIRRERAILSFRIFGVIARIEEFDVEIAKGIARGLWNLSGHSQWVESDPVDTAFTYDHAGRKYRIRGSSLKDTRGNSIVCRVRDPGYILPLDKSGYSDHQTSLIKRICMAPGGLILITGETNSGKSTTMAALMDCSSHNQRMIEIADPCEVEFEHCTHVELDHYREDADEAFRNILAATVRQNPDALVLGEIRDEITAHAAQNMAIQGKRVFSTLHTQSCVAAIPRLASFGVDHHLLSLREFIAGIVNQNLVPLICQRCCLERHPETDKDRHYRALFGSAVRYINPAGCDQCVSGVAGQTLVAEVYPFFFDRKDAHKYISNHELFRLETYMKKEFNIESKQDHAKSKVRLGLIDPEKTEEIIGEWAFDYELRVIDARAVAEPGDWDAGS